MAAEHAESLTRRPCLRVHRAAGAVCGLVGVVLLAFLRALEDQIGRLHVPGAPKEYPYSALHKADAARALKSWRDGVTALSTFHPVTPDTMIRIHAGVATICTVLLALFAFFVVDRWFVGGSAVRLCQVVCALAIVGLAGASLDRLVSLGRGPSWSHVAFTVLAVLKVTGVVVVALVVVVGRFDALVAARHAYRNAPATARLILFGAIGFAALLQSGDIGAQAEDMLRRELEQGYLPVVRLLLELGLYLAVVAVVSRITLPSGHAPSPRKLIVYGSVLIVAGAGALWGSGG